MSSFDFSDRVAIVGGGGGGIGVAVARRFIEAGARVLIVGRSAERLDRAVQDFERLGISVDGLETCPADLARWEENERVAEECKRKFGRVDFLVNSAGLWAHTPIEDLSDEVIDDFVDVNLKTVAYGARLAMRSIERGGSVINFGSFAGLIPMARSSLYSSLKSAVQTFTRSAAAELAHLGIRVNCVIPGVIRTPMTSDHIDRNQATILRAIPMGRVGETVEVADGVLFLCSDLASYITGATLEITGGKFSTQP